VKIFIVLTLLFSSTQLFSLPPASESLADYHSRLKSKFKGEKLDIIFENNAFKKDEWYLSWRSVYSGFWGIGWKKSWSNNGKVKTTIWVRKQGNNYLIDGPNVWVNHQFMLFKYEGRMKDAFPGLRKVKGKAILFSGTPKSWYEIAKKKKEIKIKLKSIESVSLFSSGITKEIAPSE